MLSRTSIKGLMAIRQMQCNQVTSVLLKDISRTQMGVTTQMATRSYTHVNKKLSSEDGAAHTPGIGKTWQDTRIMVVGCKGQVGIPMVNALCEELGNDQVVACDISDRDVDFSCKFERLDVCDKDNYERIIKENKINYIVHLAAILSALGER